MGKNTINSMYFITDTGLIQYINHINITTATEDYLKKFLFNKNTDISFNIGNTISSAGISDTKPINIINIIDFHKKLYDNYITKKIFDFNISNNNNITIKIVYASNELLYNSILTTIENKIYEAIDRLYKLTDIIYKYDVQFNDEINNDLIVNNLSINAVKKSLYDKDFSLIQLYNDLYKGFKKNNVDNRISNGSYSYYNFSFKSKIKVGEQEQTILLCLLVTDMANIDYYNTILTTIETKIKEAVARLYQLGITDIRHDLDGKMNELLQQGENSLFMKSEGEYDSAIYTNLLWTVAGTSLLFIFFMNI